jgi:MFS family permease
MASINVNGVPGITRITERDIKFAAWVCFFAWTFAVYDYVLFGDLLPKLALTLGWSASKSTFINTLVSVGVALVAFGVGPLVDRVGRRKGILIAVIGAAVFSGVTGLLGFATGILAGFGVVILIIVRSIGGLGYAEQAINATYLNELFAHVDSASPGESRPHRKISRGLMYSLVQSGWPIGSVLAAESISLLLPIGGWQLCFLVAMFPVIFMIWAAFHLKESPQFVVRREAEELLKEGRNEEAHALASTGGVDLTELSAPAVAIFKGKELRTTVTIGTAFFLSWWGVLCFDILGTSLLTAKNGKDIAFTGTLTILAVSNGAAFIGYVFHGWLGGKIGRRNTVAIGWVLSGLSFIAMLLVQNGNYGLIVMFYSLGLFFLIGPYAALLLFNAESYPTHSRATGGAFLNAMGMVGAVVAGLLVTHVLGIGSSWTEAVFWFGCIPILLSGIIILGTRNVDPDKVQLF